MKSAVRFVALAGWFLGMGVASPAFGHAGPPFPIIEDSLTGPYVVSVWTDPDIGKGTFFVVLEPPEGRTLPQGTRVRIGLQPVSGRLEEVVYDTAPRKARKGERYFLEAPLDVGELWRVRVVLEGPEGGEEVAAEVMATPEGTIGRVGLVLYLLPFLAAGFLWVRAARRSRRAR